LKSRQLKVKYFANGKRMEVNDYFDSKTENILNIQQKKRTIYNPSSFSFIEEPTLFYKIPILEIQSISTLQKPFNSFISVIGFCGITYSTVIIIAAFNKSRLDFKN